MKVEVRKGDSFWYYSQLFKVPVQLIVDSNPNVEPSQLSIGQSIMIPGFYIDSVEILKGDTLWKIAKSRNLPLDALFLLNQQLNPQNLSIGQSIFIPVRVTNLIVNGNQEYDYSTMKSDLEKLINLYPFIKNKSIGQSVLNQSIPELRIGSGQKEVHINGSFHANEWITTAVLMKFLNEYVLSLTNNQSIRGLQVNPLYNQTVLSLVPMVNPDGVDLVLNGPPQNEQYKELVLKLNEGNMDFSNWKANIRGVDLNNQFPAKWEIEKERKPQSPAPRDYPGEAPLSEPEAKAMAQLTERRDFARVSAFHTQGEVIYWGFLNLEPSEAKTIVEEFERVSGYEPIRTIDSYAGYKDWFIQEWQRPGYTVELGTGVNPLPISQFDEIYQESLGILLANLYM